MTEQCKYWDSEIKTCRRSDVPREHGEWLPPDKGFDTKAWRKCSVCGIHSDIYPRYTAFDGSIHYFKRISNFCSNCGADMRSKGDEE